MLTEQDILDKVKFADSIGIDSNRQNPHGPRHSPEVWKALRWTRRTAS